VDDAVMKDMVCIGVDAMGGDHGSPPVVAGAVGAVRRLEGKVRIILVGDQKDIAGQLARLNAEEMPIEIVHASERITMSEDPLKAVRKKTDSSLNILAGLQARGITNAMISSGSTGAVIASAQLALGKLPGVHRPAIASFVPTAHGNSVVVDAGATPDCRPINLLQFAIMGCLYARYVLQLREPRVGLISIGEERDKGNELSKAAHRLLERSGLNFIGNVEGRDVLRGKADVVVCDGFVGNIVLKFVEGALSFVAARVRREIGGSHLARFGAWLLRPTMVRLRNGLDPEEMGGAPLLGLNGVCIVAHGRSGPRAITNAVRMAHRFVKEGLNDQITKQLESIASWDDAGQKVTACAQE
jgi:glycerol-3-phosphate acyltransferase PlsX